MSFFIENLKHNLNQFVYKNWILNFLKSFLCFQHFENLNFNLKKFKCCICKSKCFAMILKYAWQTWFNLNSYFLISINFFNAIKQFCSSRIFNVFARFRLILFKKILFIFLQWHFLNFWTLISVTLIWSSWLFTEFKISKSLFFLFLSFFSFLLIFLFFEFFFFFFYLHLHYRKMIFFVLIFFLIFDIHINFD